MSKDRNFERRMIVSKFSNRPPFDLKKSKDTYDILDKIKEYPVESCRNCCTNMTKISKNTVLKPGRNQTSEDLDDAGDVSPGKRAIPKIIQTFQNLSISRESEDPVCQQASIQTLYRNRRSCNLGKNIPKHKLMKSLLQNLDSEVDSCKKCLVDSPFPSKRRLKYKKCSAKKHISYDKEPAPVNSENNNNKILELFTKCTNQRSQIDKKTSTTGLTWPPGSREVLQYPNILPQRQMSQKTCNRSHGKQQSSISSNTIKKQCHRKPVSQLRCSSSFLDEVPTRDVPQNYCVEPTRSEKLMRKNVASISQLRQMSLEDSSVHKKSAYPLNRTEHQDQDSPQKLMSREKSFVQTQVEKLNKVMRITKPPVPRLSRPQNDYGSLQKKGEAHHCMGYGDCLKKNAAASNYVGLMDQIRSNVPRIHKSDNYDSFASDNEWSVSGTEINPEHIRFPKETKTAIDQHLSEKKVRPLSKFTKSNDNFIPAIPPIQEVDDVYYLQGRFPKNTAKEKPRQRRKKNVTIPADVKPTINMPCKKNLLCDKGEQHSGVCGYTHNRNKVIY